VNRTRFLLALLVVVVFLQLFPDKSRVIEAVAVGGVALYCLLWAGSRYLAQFRDQRQKAALAAADGEEYRHYESELTSIRAKHDPHRDANEADVASQEYKDELSALHDRHRDMLNRRFGPG
jgi:hypothetical protein